MAYSYTDPTHKVVERLEKENATLKEDIFYKDEHIDRLDKYLRPEIKILCSSCSQEFPLKMFGEYAAMRQTVSNFENCPHCGDRNDTWVAVDWLSKLSLNKVIAEGILKMLQYYADGKNTMYCTIDRLKVEDILRYVDMLREETA